MPCEHDLAEMDTAAHWDGLCPLCMNTEIERLRSELKEEEATVYSCMAKLKEMQTKLDKIAKHPNTPELIRQYAAGILDDRTAGPLNSALS